MDHEFISFAFSIDCIVHEHAGCRDGPWLLSQNRTLAPLAMIDASSDSVTSKSNVYNFGYDGSSIITWCTWSSDTNIHVELGFTSTILITSVISSGRISHSTLTDSLGMFYVSNFTLEHSLSSSASTNFTFYQGEANYTKVL